MFSKTDSSLVNLLVLTHESKTTDPRDHVYGILGMYLAGGRVQKLPDVLVPEYGKSLKQVLLGAACVTTTEHRRLRWMNTLDCPHNRPGYRDLPSWVSLWHLPFEARRLKALFKAYGTMCGYRPSLATDNAHCLLLKGIVVDKVTQALPAVSETQTAQELLALVQRLRALASRSGSAVDDGQITRVLIGGSNYKQQLPTPEDTASFKLWYEELEATRQLLSQQSDAPESTQTFYDPEYAQTSQFHAAFREAAIYRRPFTTSSGYLGLGSRTLEVNDLVTVLHGCQWPVILRRIEDHYRIVGLAYVDGIMFGEACDQGLPEVQFNVY